MESKILVGLRPRDEITELVPCIETMAGSGTTLVCLLRYPVVEPWKYVRDHCVSADSTKVAVAAGGRLMSDYSWEAQKRFAAQKLAPVIKTMSRKSVHLEVDLYTGNVLAAIMKRISDPSVRWVIVPARAMNGSSALVEAEITPFASFKWAILYSRRSGKESRNTP